jgi:hypothetical protein
MSSTYDIFVPLFCVPCGTHCATWTGHPEEALGSSLGYPGRGYWYPVAYLVPVIGDHDLFSFALMSLSDFE